MRLRALVLGVFASGLACSGTTGSRSGTSDDALAAPTSVALRDGTVVRGTAIARYDHATWWWDAADDVTFAMFDPSAASNVPGEDRSLRFVSRSNLAAGQREPEVTSSPPSNYRAYVRARGVGFDRLPLDGVATVLNGHERWHLQEAGFGDFAWDLVRLHENGKTFATDGRAVEDYAVWDSPVFLPTAGYVVDVDDSAPDNVPGYVPDGPLSEIKNNMVGVQVAGSYYVYLLHFREGTIPRRARGTCEPTVPGVACVEPGEHLPVGAYLGRVGNSGVTYEPHLHVTTYFWDTSNKPARSWSVPSEFRSLYARPKGRSQTNRETDFVPATDDALSNVAF